MSSAPQSSQPSSQQPPKRASRGGLLGTRSRTGRRWAYLVFYNSAMCTGWVIVAAQMWRGLAIGYLSARNDPAIAAYYTCKCPFAPFANHINVFSHGQQQAFSAGEFLTKTLLGASAMEIVHSATGFVKSPVVTTVIQTFTRLAVFSFALEYGPGKKEVKKSPFPGIMLGAWTTGEIIRYAYYVANLLAERRKAAARRSPRATSPIASPQQPTSVPAAGGTTSPTAVGTPTSASAPSAPSTDSKRLAAAAAAANFTAPGWLTWLRYSAFVVLYPAGFIGEMGCLYTSLPALERTGKWSISLPNTMNFALWVPGVVRFILAVCYPPGMYVMYTHMLRQRRKVMRRTRE